MQMMHSDKTSIFREFLEAVRPNKIQVLGREIYNTTK